MTDAIMVAVIVSGAAGFLVWRFRTKPAAPPCGSVPEAKPQVILGARFARGLAAARRAQQPPKA